MTFLKYIFPLVFLVTGYPTLACGFDLQPLTTRNISPLVIGFGLPSVGSARVLDPGTAQGRLVIDLASNFTKNTSDAEILRFDGETCRVAVAGDYGIGLNVEIGFELPLISHQAGFLDNFIEEWHAAFGLPQGGRDLATSDQFGYGYIHQGEKGFTLNSETAGLGDLSLRAAWQLWHNEEKRQGIALRTNLKLPLGDAGRLTGTGSTDFSIWLSGEQRLQTTSGMFFLYVGGGGLLSSDGELLADQRQNLIGFVSFGCGWQPGPNFGLQLQFDGHSPFYRHSQLKELDGFAGQLAIGGSLSLGRKSLLELALVEDIVVDTASDVVFHLALTRRF